MDNPTQRRRTPLPPAVGLLFAGLSMASLGGCGGSTPTPDAGVSPDAASTEVDAPSPGTDAPIAATDSGGGGSCVPAEVIPCIDEQLSQLDLFDTVNPAVITEEGTTPGEFVTWIDATGGGRMPTESFVYARFTDDGLTKVEIGDEDAFTSTDWDISFRRFLIRLNSGVSGPSCVTGARTAPGTTFESLSSVPDGLSYRVEEYFTETCETVPDGSGLGSPATALSSYWTYPGCVSMTGNVYVIALTSGRHVRFEVVGYYPLDLQEMCESSMTLPTPSNAANFRVRWAFLD